MIKGSPEIPRALAATSVVYVASAAFLYLVPMLLNDASLVQSGSTVHHWIGGNYWAFYLCMGTARILGPILSEAIRFRNLGDGAPARRREFALWSSLVCWSLLAAAGAYLVLPREYADLALPLLVLARIFAEAFKPVQAAYLNELVSLRSMRAFTLSLTTALGSLFVSAIAWIAMTQSGPITAALESWARPARSVPVVLTFGALAAWLVLRVALRAGKPQKVVPEMPPLPFFAPAADVQAALERALEARERLRGTGLIPVVRTVKGPRAGRASVAHLPVPSRPRDEIPARPKALRQSRAALPNPAQGPKAKGAVHGASGARVSGVSRDPNRSAS
jgi:hypothetical protein